MRAVGLAALIAGLIGSSAIDDDRDWQQGTWTVEAFESAGVATPPEIRATIERVVEGDHVVWKRQGKAFAGTTMTIDPAAQPKAIDLVSDGGPQRGEPVLGIYRRDGDRLTVCMAARGDPRPSAFDAPKGSGRTLYVLRKATAGGSQ